MAEQESDDVLLEEYLEDNQLCVLTLNRPHKLNAISKRLNNRLADVFRLFNQAPASAPKVVIITGRGGKSWSAGVDLSDPVDLKIQTSFNEKQLRLNPVYQMNQFNGVIIGAINGYCFTGGLELALNCDFLIATKNAVFADTHAKFGLVPCWGMSALLPRTVGMSNARYMTLTASRIDAETAKDWGLVTRIVDTDLLQHCKLLAQSVLKLNLEAVKKNKRILELGNKGTLEQALRSEIEQSVAHYSKVDGATRFGGASQALSEEKQSRL